MRGTYRTDLRARAAYAEGAGIYRIVPAAVARPADGADLQRLVRWAGTIGYRYVSIEKEVTERAALDINIQGPLFGITYKF